MSNINDHFFDGLYKDVWRAIIPTELTTREVDFLINHFQLAQGKKVLDLMCGYGRHTIALAEKGINVTAIDNLEAYTTELKSIVSEKKLPVTVLNQDVLNYVPKQDYDLAICMGNSLNFFNSEDTQKILKQIANGLKPGGHLLIHSWSIAEIAYTSFKEKTWSQVGDLKMLSDSRILFQPTRMETESTILNSGSIKEVKRGIDYIFSIAEYEKMMTDAGFGNFEMYSVPGKKVFSLGEPRIYIIAQKK